MTKLKTTFFCQNCGTQSAQWMGKCKSCGEWNTMVEEVINKPKSGIISWDKKKYNNIIIDGTIVIKRVVILIVVF